MPARRAALLVAGVTLAVVPAGCGAFEEPPPPTRITAAPEDAPTPPASTEGATVADLAFAQRMVPLHEQALELADLVPGRTDSPELLALAEEIPATRRPEIDRMTGWLEEWGAEVGSAPADVPGLLAGADVEALREASGAEFDRRWLDAMLAHHEGVVSVAETAIGAATDRPTVELAEDVVRVHRSEAARMQAMLGS